MSSFVARLARMCARYPWVVLGLALIVSGLSILAASKLPVHTSRQALLPQNTEVAQRLNRFLEKFGSASDLMVVLENAPRNDLETFATELAIRLRSEPEIAQVTERLDPAFFLDHAYLMMPLDQLHGLEGLIKTGKTKETPSLDRLLNQVGPLFEVKASEGIVDLESTKLGLHGLKSFLGEWTRWIKEPTVPNNLDWQHLSASVGAEALGGGFFASRNGQMLVMFVHARNHSSDFSVLKPFNEKVRDISQQLANEYQTQGKAQPMIGFTGLPAIEFEEYIDIERDIKLVIWSAVGLIAGLILVVVRSIRWAIAIFVPMGLGALWSLALAYLTVGHLTIITSSFLAILFGLGADYGIFTSSQIAEERKKGSSLNEAIAHGMGSSFPALLTAGGASLMVFGALATVDFPGFAELGLVAAGGVLLIVISTWFVQPAIYSLLPPKIRTPIKSASKNLVNMKGCFPKRLAIGLVFVSVVTASAGLFQGIHLPFDYDVLALLPKDSKAAQYQRRMVNETDYQSEVVIFTAENIEDARRITKEAGNLKSIAKVQSITNLFPQDAEHRLTLAQDLGRTIEKSTLKQQIDTLDEAGISTGNFKQIKSLLQQSVDRIDEDEEKAFSSGHSDIVKELDDIRAEINIIIDSIDSNPREAQLRSEAFYRSLLAATREGLKIVTSWKSMNTLDPIDLPSTVRDRFFASDGTIAVYAFPAESVYNPKNLDRLVSDVYQVSPNATGFPTTHQVFSKAVVDSFTHGTVLAIAAGLLWLCLVLRNVKGFVLASLPLFIGGGWMLGLMALFGLRYNYANIIALPLVIALAVDYGVWYSHRWRELEGWSPFAITMNAGKVIALAAGTEFAGLGAITLASYRGVSSLGIDITLGLVTCLIATLVVAPAIGQILESKSSP